MSETGNTVESSTHGGGRIEGIAERLQRNVSSQNYVYAVGYSLERVHSGTLAACLRADDECSKAIGAALWNWPDGSGLHPHQISHVEVQHEFKLAPGCVTDLVVTLHAEGTTRRIVMEYKVDGTGGHEDQCLRTSRHSQAADRVYFVTLGGAEFLDGPDRWKGEGHRAVHFRLNHMVELLQPQCLRRALLPAYLEALHDEQLRREHCFALAQLAESNSRCASKLGYRRFDWWYAAYEHLRNWLPAAEQNHWSIWSGTNNAVMNWRLGFDGPQRDCGGIDGTGSLYIEVRNDRLVGCVAWSEQARRDSARAKTLVSIIRPLLSDLPGDWTPVSRVAAPNLYGTWGATKVSLSAEGAAYLSQFANEHFPRFCKRVRKAVADRHD
ncbi:MAG: hypothetical protein IT430_14595 [Phycisphaerales bacterium]|nr:hypothetical protein [Phycisphaerales bacterium]